jgi:hypothetical protein
MMNENDIPRSAHEPVVDPHTDQTEVEMVMDAVGIHEEMRAALEALAIGIVGVAMVQMAMEM